MLDPTGNLVYKYQRWFHHKHNGELKMGQSRIHKIFLAIAAVIALSFSSLVLADQVTITYMVNGESKSVSVNADTVANANLTDEEVEDNPDKEALRISALKAMKLAAELLSGHGAYSQVSSTVDFSGTSDIAAIAKSIVENGDAADAPQIASTIVSSPYTGDAPADVENSITQSVSEVEGVVAADVQTSVGAVTLGDPGSRASPS